MGYKTKIVTGAKEFICIGGFFYLEYNNSISSLSKYKKRIILSDAEIEFTAQGDFTTTELYSTNGEYYFSINDFSVLPNANDKLGIISATLGENSSSYLGNLKYRVENYHNTTIYIVFSLKDLGTYNRFFYLVELPDSLHFDIEKTHFRIAEISKSFNFVLNKKYIAVLRIPAGVKVRYSAFLNKNKIITTNDYSEERRNNWSIRDEYIASPNIDIDYIGFCPECHTDDKVYSNMKYLAKFFEVDLEEPS